MPKVKTVIKLQAPAGQATPAPPIGPALGQHGVNIQEFVTTFNDRTKAMGDDIIPVEVTIFEDRTFTFKLKTPPAATLLLKAAGVEKGSATPATATVGRVTKAQVRAIAERKLPDLSAHDLDAAMRIIEGTARSMGITVEGKAAMKSEK